MIKITGEYITLGQLLKLLGLAHSGGAVKDLLGSKQILVNGQKETRRGRKLFVNDTITIAEKQYVITHAD